MKSNKRNCFRDYFCADESYEGKDIPRYLLFSMKMDNCWSENLWKLAEYDVAKADTAMYKIVCRYFWNMAVGVSKKELGENIRDYFYSENEDDFDFDYYQRVLNTTLKTVDDAKGFFNDLIKYMDNLTSPSNYANISRFIKESLQGTSRDKVTFEKFFAIDESDKDDKDGFSFGLNERFINFGLQLCLQAGDTINDSWKRFIWNITYAGNVNDAKETTISHINGIRKFGEHTNDIYKHLSTFDIENERINAIKYEIRKAQYVGDAIKNPECANIFRSFEDLEKHPFLQGDIDWFVLDDPENDSEDLYLNRAKNAKTLFNNDGLNPDNRHLVVRYILSQRMMKLDSSSSIYISEYDKDREGLLKTQMHKEDWDKVIRDLLAIPNDKIITEMGKACKDMTLPYGSANSEWKYWHNLICQNPDFYEKICDIKSGFTPRLSCIEKTLAVVMLAPGENRR